jgi:hypothetical protein
MPLAPVCAADILDCQGALEVNGWSLVIRVALRPRDESLSRTSPSWNVMTSNESAKSPTVPASPVDRVQGGKTVWVLDPLAHSWTVMGPAVLVPCKVIESAKGSVWKDEDSGL